MRASTIGCTVVGALRPGAVGAFLLDADRARAVHLPCPKSEGAGREMAHLNRALVHALGGGDLFLSPERPPWVRAGGKLRALGSESAAPKDVGELLLKVAPPKHRKVFERAGSVTFVAEYGGLGRFRVHIFRDRVGSAAVVRLVPGEVASFEGLGLPETARDLCSRRGGLVIVAGPAGSGRTTTLAAMIGFVKRERASHILTVENSMEFIHEPGQSLVHQREVGTHCGSFAEALRSGLREGADVILLGDVPDAETAEAALDAAASGSLVLAEMRAKTAELAVERLLALFPPGKRDYARAALASSLSGVIVQRLLPRTDGRGVAAAFEVLVSTPAVASAIRESGARNITSAIRSGARAGMKLLDDALLELIASGKVAGPEASAAATNEEEFRRKCDAAGVALDAEMFLPSTEPERRTRRRPRTASFSEAEVPAGEGNGARPSLAYSAEAALAAKAGKIRRAPSDPAPVGAGLSVGRANAPGALAKPDTEPPENPADLRIVAGRQILVVDDDAEIRDLLVRMLQGAGARVKAVEEPLRALAEIRSGSYDLAMFDILMPDVSGTELYDQAVSVAPALRERVLFVTGCKLDGQLSDRIAARGGRLLRKPFVADDLLKAAASTLAYSAEAASAAKAGRAEPGRSGPSDDRTMRRCAS